VIDLGMIDGEHGGPLIEHVLTLFPGSRCPIIGLSGDPAADPEWIGRLGIDRFITKPFSISLLRSAARELLDTYRT
jgi:DNA-binding response OmpR family regulator